MAGSPAFQALQMQGSPPVFLELEFRHRREVGNRNFGPLGVR